MTKTIKTTIKAITPWIFADTNEKFSHLEVYFAKEGKNSYKGINGTKQQITEKLTLSNNMDLDSQLHCLIGKKVQITKDAQTGMVTSMKMILSIRSTTQRWFSWQRNKEIPEYC